MKIKICGLTTPKEADYINEAKADYAGFVFYPKSKRNVTIGQAAAIAERLDPSVKKVAVTVSPEETLVEQIVKSGFDILQVHKELSLPVLEAVTLPVWYACNVADPKQLQEAQAFLAGLPERLRTKIEAVVVDGAEYGSGKPFDWHKSRRLKKAGAQSPPELFADRSFVLAGGLNPSNVAEGIRLFHPDVVDVSSGVEGAEGKDRERILCFVRNARAAEKIK